MSKRFYFIYISGCCWSWWNLVSLLHCMYRCCSIQANSIQRRCEQGCWHCVSVTTQEVLCPPDYYGKNFDYFLFFDLKLNWNYWIIIVSKNAWNKQTGAPTDMPATVEALVRGAELPLSVLIVSLGDADLAELENEVYRFFFFLFFCDTKCFHGPSEPIKILNLVCLDFIIFY